MKKILIAVAAILILSPLMVIGAGGYATIINNEGVKKVIKIGQSIPKGFGLMTEKRLGGSTVPNPAFVTKVLGVEGSYPTIGTAGQSSIITTGYDYNMVKLDIEWKPSTSTASIFSITPYTTSDGCASTSDWFPLGLVTQSGLVSTTTAPMVYTFATATTTDQYFQLTLKDVNSSCIKFVTTVSSNATTSTALIRALVTNY